MQKSSSSHVCLLAVFVSLSLMIQIFPNGTNVAFGPKMASLQRSDEAQPQGMGQPERVLPLHIVTNYPNASITYQQAVSLDPSKFQQYMNQNLSNLLFTYANGTPINAWIQTNATNSSTQTVFWLSLSGVLNRTILVVLYSKNTSLLGPGSYLGEAPQLSPVYGQFDNGPRVFPFYNDFEGDSLNESAWTQQGAGNNFTVDDGFLLGDDQWSGILSTKTYDAAAYASGLYLNFSTSVYLDTAVGTSDHVRLLGGGDGRYFIGDAYGFTNGSFTDTNGFDFFSFWTNSTTGHINFAKQTLNITYGYDAGLPNSEQISIRSDSVGWISVKYALLRTLPEQDSGYMPGVGISPNLLPLNAVGLYQIDFLEAGLPRSQLWELTLPRVGIFTSSVTTISIALANGTYQYLTFSADENYSSGVSPAVFVVNGYNASLRVLFSLIYTLEFRESGLPLGWLWSVNLTGNSSGRSYSQYLSLKVINGTYLYSVQTSDPSYAAEGGRIVVAGPPAELTVNFTASGPSGTENNVTFYTSLLAVTALVVAVIVVLRLRRRRG